MASIVKEMLVSHDPSETRVAVLEDGELVELYVERPKRSVVGNVYLGRVRDVLPGMQAAFVDVGLEKNAFLYVDEVVAPEGLEDLPRRDIQSLLKPGQQVVVQVVKDPMGTKGARVTTDVSLPGRFLVLMPFSDFVGASRKLEDAERDRLSAALEAVRPEGVGVIARTAAAGASDRDIASDLEFLMRLWKRVQALSREAVAPEMLYTEMDLPLRLVRDAFGEDFRRLLVDHKETHDKITSFLKRTSPQLGRRVHLYRDSVPLFDSFALQERLDTAIKRTVPLPSGGHITIDKTEALTAIDVNTGSYTGRSNLEDTALRTDLEAADEAVRQIRLRDIGGIIVIDFIDLEQAQNRGLVMTRLQRALDRDRTKSRISEMSRLGMVEMTRKNVTDGLYGVLTEPCPTCHGEGRVVSDATKRITVERRMREILAAGRSPAYLFGLSPDTYELVMSPGRNVLAMLRSETGKQVAIVPERDCDATEVRVLMEGKAGAVERALG
ncbi:MAG: Rne/Rng family ribonuclease [Actinobacteria bacterium]|nr:MAG: Rne/Rng family ribonuclease [Actinomycetota bacterium]